MVAGNEFSNTGITLTNIDPEGTYPFTVTGPVPFAKLPSLLLLPSPITFNTVVQIKYWLLGIYKVQQ
jgi:hypothetical protein